MSLKGVRSSIEELISSESPLVLAMTGPWGSGKTFYWRKLITELKSSDRFIAERYAYVSLFGVNSLDALRFLIFQQMTPRAQIGEAITVDNLRRNTTALFERLGRKAAPLVQRLLGELPFIGSIGETVQAGAFLTVRDAILCIDDFERRGEELRTAEVLGLVSLLKDERNCRVVLIFDRDRLGDSMEDYDTLREKVVDIEVRFDPLPGECCDLVFDKRDPNEELLHEFSGKLGIRNIRVLSKLQRVARLVMPHLASFEPRLRYQAAQTLTLVTYCLFVRAPDVPSIDFVKGLNSAFGSLGEKVSEQHERWRETLESYGYVWTSDFDLELINTVERGYVDADRLNAAARLMNEELVTSRFNESISDVWSKFRNTFADNTEDFVKSLSAAVRAGIGSIAPGSLNSAVRVLRELAREELADELLDLYIATNRHNPERFNPDNLFSDKLDQKLVAQFKDVYAAAESPLKLRDAVMEMSGDSYSGRAERSVLAATEDQFYDLFKNFEGPDLQACIRGCLRIGKFTNATDEQKAAVQRVISALRRIAHEIPLNAIRVRAAGVSDA